MVKFFPARENKAPLISTLASFSPMANKVCLSAFLKSSDFKTKIIFRKESLLQIIKTASLFARSGINDLKIKFLPKEEKIIISSLNNQVGENEAELKVEISGNNNDVSFNYQYLLDGLLNLGGDELSLEIIDSNLPGVIRSTSDDSFLYLIMPIKSNE